MSRLVVDMADQVLARGRGRATAYASPQAIHGYPAQQPIWLTDEAGAVRRAGTLSFLENHFLHVEASFGTFTTRDALPWPVAPLRAQGFLGRLLAQRLSASGLAADPEQWRLGGVLFAALQLHDAPGALTIGNMEGAQSHPRLSADLESDLEAIAADAASTLPAGASAGGEQPKFLAVRAADNQHVLVKFTPPRGKPFGERWHDLLVCEHVAGKTLVRHGIAAAKSHIVSIGEAHAAFTAGAFNGWGLAAEALARQRRLPARDVEHAQFLQHFGRLIGNSDMHSGNLALFVDLLAKPRFSPAPAYDMLPMRWRPDATLGGASDYARVSKKLRSVTKEMAARIVNRAGSR